MIVSAALGATGRRIGGARRRRFATVASGKTWREAKNGQGSDVNLN